MRLATRTGLAALLASVVSILLLTVIATAQFERVLRERVDIQLEERAVDAPILAAVGERVAVSELNTALDVARVTTDTGVTDIGRMPLESFPPAEGQGLRTVRASGEDWRLLTVEVTDVPRVGDSAVVEFAAPLGDVQARSALLRRRMAAAGLVACALAGFAGLVFGRRAARPLTQLQRDVAGLEGRSRDDWRVTEDSGVSEVDDVARALNASLGAVAAAHGRREEALTAARSFAASATHELRTPLQSAMTNLDIGTAGGAEAIAVARSDLDRMGSALAAVRAFSDAELVDPSWFERLDVADLVEEVVARVASIGGEVEIQGSESMELTVWGDGVRLALDNLVRNACTHGRDPNRGDVRVLVTIDAGAGSVTVDDDGPGIPPADRARVLAPFERGTTEVAGSGLGLAFVERVAQAHRGSCVIEDSPQGGTRVVFSLRSVQPD